MLVLLLLSPHLMKSLPVQNVVPTCATLGYLLSFIGTMILVGGVNPANIKTFAILYVLGNVSTVQYGRAVINKNTVNYLPNGVIFIPL